MSICVYVGPGGTHVGDREFDVIGQRAEFDAPAYKDVLAGGGAFLLEPQYKALNFTELDIRILQYGTGTEYEPALQEKIKRARQLVTENMALAKIDAL